MKITAINCILPRNPGSRIQKIPYPAMEVAGLSDADELRVQVGKGYILIGRNDLSAREAVYAISSFRRIADALLHQLADASVQAGNFCSGREKGVDELDQGTRQLLGLAGVDLHGLQVLLDQEED